MDASRLVWWYDRASNLADVAPELFGFSRRKE